MTDDQINQAIAEACGIVGKSGEIYKTSEGWVVDCPDYCTDLNAMHEAEKVLIGHEGNRYGGFAIYLTKYDLTLVGLEKAIHATARQRAEAFLRTLGKWSATDKESLTVQPTTEESSVVQKEVQG